MALDPKAYKSGVVVPLAKDPAQMDAVGAAIRGLKSSAGMAAIAQIDVARLLAVDPQNPGDLVAHFKSLEITLNKWGGNPPSAALIRQLTAAMRDAGLDITATSFWGAQAQAQAQAQASLIGDFIRGLAADFPLGVLTQEQLESAAKGAGLGSLSLADLTMAARNESLTVSLDFEVPTTVVPPVLSNVVTQHPDFRTVADLLTFPHQATAVTFIDAVALDGKLVTLTDVLEAHKRSETAKDSNAVQDAQKALGLLKNQCSTDAQLHELIRGALFKQLTAAVSRGGTRVQQRDALVGFGLDRIEAARVVTKLTTGGTASKLPSELILAALGAGNLAEARRLATALPELDEDQAERASAVAKISAAEKAKAAHVEAFERAKANRDFRTAATELAAALLIDAADAVLASQMTALPPPRPEAPSLRIDGRAVALSWPPLAEADVTYLVVRAEGAAPTDPGAGHRLGEPSSTPSARDTQAPVGRHLFYSVFATRDGRQFSDPASASVTVLPAPTEVVAAADATQVTLSWQVPSEAIAALVTQHAPDGRDTEFEVTGGRSFTATGLTLGNTYGFSVRGVYVTAQGRETSAPVRIEATPRGAIAAAGEFQARVVNSGNTHILECSWRDVEGYVVDVWAFPITHPPLPSRVASDSELMAAGGQRLTPMPGGGVADGHVVRRFAAGDGMFAYLPVTVDGQGGLLGASIIAGVAPPATNVIAERFGDAIKVSWVWPEGDYLMEVAWLEGGRTKSKRVTRAKYRLDGGVTLSPATAIAKIEVATVVRAADEEWVSVGVAVDYAAAKPPVPYTLTLRKPLLGSPSARVALDPGGFSGEIEVELVCATGPFMPPRPSDGSTVGRERVTLVAGKTSTLDFSLPKLPSPFWARLFAVDGSGIVLLDPPTSQMKG